MILLNKLLGLVPMVYRGGGKSGGGATAAPAPVMTTTSIGNILDTAGETLKEDDKATKAIDKKKLGTRGLQIPLESPQTTPKASVSGGVQV